MTGAAADETRRLVARDDLFTPRAGSAKGEELLDWSTTTMTLQSGPMVVSAKARSKPRSVDRSAATVLASPAVALASPAGATGVSPWGRVPRSTRGPGLGRDTGQAS